MEIIGGFVGQAVIYGLIFFYPAWRILGRAGLSPWFALLIFLSGLGMLILLVLLAFARWPALDGDGARG